MSKNKEGFLKKKGVWKKILIVLILIAGTTVITAMWGKKSSANDYITATIERTDITTNVNATGTLQAITTVQVGSQASGTISWLGVDFNSKVKKGEVIARLDPSTLQSQVDNAKAALQSAQAAEAAARTAYDEQQANVNSARANTEVLRVQRDDAVRLATRNRELATVISTRDIESSVANADAANARLLQANAQVEQSKASMASSKAKIDQAIAQVKQAQASLDQAQSNLDKTVITSPIDGTVVSRAIDVGQTVAASLQAPTLFTIANDLSKMQVLANIDEADVGQIKEGQTTNFTVDAYPGETFTGTILQVRLSAITTQNVVTYNAVINFDNPGERLRPGMTANVIVPVEHRENVLVVPNVALRFKPPADEAKLAWQEKNPKGQSQAGQQTGQPQADQPANGENPSAQHMRPARDRQNSQNGHEHGQHADQGQPPGNESQPTQTGADQSTKTGAEQPANTDADQSAKTGSPAPKTKKQVLWVVNENGKLDPRRVEIGITDGKVSEIVSGNLKEGDHIAISVVETEHSSSQPATSPFGGRPGGSTRPSSSGSRGGR